MKKKSEFYKSYIRRLIIRSIILITTIIIYIYFPNTFNVVKGINFIKMFSPLHILWCIWMFDMILQLCEVPKYWPLGSQKYLKERYQPDKIEIDEKLIKKHMKKISSDSISVAISWILLLIIIYILYLTKIIPYEIVIIISTVFYVCDIICIVIWCPFKTFYMHNKCCTTCRIFNWHHAMMFTPLIIIPGIWTYSLVIMSIIIVIVWEYNCFRHPERFLEKTNCALRCHNCNDKLCGK